MNSPPDVTDEPARLALLGSVSLTREPEARFDDLVELAAFTAHTPMAGIAIVGAEEAWAKSIIGFEPDRVARGESFATAAITGTAPLIVPDTLTDPAFATHPFVVGPPAVRFYAGFPLVIDGHAVGSLWVADTRPRNLLSDERHALRVIADQVTAQMQLTRLEAILDLRS